ncbi:MAG: helix-turn-helix domain-containing protein [Mycobacteriales bacterium]
MPEQPARPDPAEWDEPEMLHALAYHDISAVYRLLNAAGLSQRQISQLTGQSQSEVSEIIKGGRRVLAYDLLERIADGLGIPRGHMGLAYADADGNLTTYAGEGGATDPDPEVDDEMISRRFLGMTSVALLGETVLDGLIMQLGGSLLGEPGGIRLLNGPAGTLGKHDIAWIRTATDRFRELESEYGGLAVYGAARGLAEQVVGALRSSEPVERERRDLYSSASGLCRVAAWAAFDAGRNHEFWQCHATALDLAREAGRTSLLATIVRDAGRVEIHSGRHRAAAKLFELTSVRRPPDAVTWGLLGSAYAPHSPESTRGALSHLRDAEGADTPDAIAMSGHLNLDLDDYPAAVAAFKRALPMRSGVVAIQDTTPLAVAHLQAGEIRIGVQYAETALALAENVRSKTATNALNGVGSVLAAQRDSTAQDLARQISATTAI